MPYVRSIYIYKLLLIDNNTNNTNNNCMCYAHMLKITINTKATIEMFI
jgi:hypothetical protein